MKLPNILKKLFNVKPCNCTVAIESGDMCEFIVKDSGNVQIIASYEGLTLITISRNSELSSERYLLRKFEPFIVMDLKPHDKVYSSSPVLTCFAPHMET